jgi:hypothetical protein
MSIENEEQKRAVAGGIWLFLGDIVTVWYGLALLYFIGGLILIGVIRTCEWLFGTDLGWTVGCWVMIVGAIILVAVGHKAWWKQELRRREVERNRSLEEIDRMMRQ